VLLYGMHRLECYPVDVWVKRGMISLLPNGMPPPLLPFAGVAQQYIFHYMRTCPDAPCPKRKDQTEETEKIFKQ
jgi:N-glycosylase/DNA lyase